MDTEKLKQKILDLAIRGKLVPQDSNDEPASVLIDKIREEREKLIKEGVIKASKEESIIYKGTDNCYYEKKGNSIVNLIEKIPFDIPTTWDWCRLEFICSKIVDGDHNPPKGLNKKTDYLMLSAINIDEDDLCNFDRARYLDEDAFKIENKRTNIQKGDILLTIVGTIGRSCIYNHEINICFQRSVCVISTMIFNQYLKIVLDSPYIQNLMNYNSTGTAQKGYYLNQVNSLLIPIPPFAEQKRIAYEYDKYKALLKKINESNAEISYLVNKTKEKILDSIFSNNSSYKSYYPSISINDVCKLDNGIELSIGKMPYLEAKFLRGLKEPRYVEQGIFIKKGTNIILVDGENSGEIMKPQCDGYMGSTFKILKIDASKINEDYISLFILYKKQELRESKTGSAIPHLNKKVFNSYEIPLPTIDIQIKIVKHIHNLFNVLDMIF